LRRKFAYERPKIVGGDVRLHKTYPDPKYAMSQEELFALAGKLPSVTAIGAALPSLRMKGPSRATELGRRLYSPAERGSASATILIDSIRLK
jgi:hypothetical protein